MNPLIFPFSPPKHRNDDQKNAVTQKHPGIKRFVPYWSMVMSPKFWDEAENEGFSEFFFIQVL